jgi:predicted enzyme related to lactoylglutathione lyase
MSLQRRYILKALSFAFGSSILPRHEPGMAAAQTPAQPAQPALQQESKGTQMEKVAGIGGFFFRAHDPKALGRWYLDHLGIALMPTAENSPVWEQEAGQTVFAPFPETTKYFGDASKGWMLNFRVHNLEKMIAQLRSAGIELKDPESDPNGRFTRIHDPEGNPIELWQPA